MKTEMQEERPAMTPDQRRAEIVQLAAAHVSAGRGSEEANCFAVEQHAHLCALLAEEKPVMPLNKLWREHSADEIELIDRRMHAQSGFKGKR
jgi:hypothetical protein